jgi:HlyD family secretion protein
MSQQRQGTYNTADQLLTLPGLNTSGDFNVFDDAKGPRRPRWKRVLFIVVIIIVLAGLASGLFLWQRGSTSSVTYHYQQVTTGDLSLSITATGPVQSPATYNLVAATTATIHDIQVKVGQKVTRGQVLAHLNTTALQDAVDLAQATVNSDQDTLYNTEVSAGWFDTAAVIQARDTANIAQVQLDTAKHNLANATLIAPQSGIVTQVNGTVGGVPGVSANASASAGSGGSGNGAFIQIVNLSSLQIQANVNEADTANVQVGNPVQFTVNSYGSRFFQGKVSAISSNGVTSSNVVTYPVIIDINKQSIQGAQILPGMTASVTITVIQHHNVLTIPVNAVNYARSAGNSSSGGTSIVSSQQVAAAQSQANQWLNSLQTRNPALVSENPLATYVIVSGHRGTFNVKPVVLGLTDGNSYEVLQGLASGDNVVAGVVNGG